MTEVIIRQYATADETAIAAADAAIERILEVLKTQNSIHIGITGGTVGIKTLAVWNAHAKRDQIDYSRVHFWWGDERYVAADSVDRNFKQAWDALLAHIDVPRENLHEFPSTDSGLSLDEAAEFFASHFVALQPDIDFAFMGMGPDGHIASLFPGKSSLTSESSVIAEVDSPKPPKQRLTFGLRVINESKNIWFTVAGFDKADAVSEVISNPLCDLPAAKISGKEETVWYLDQTASSKL